VIFERLLQADCLHVFLGDGERPRVAAYWRRLQERPSYRAAIGAHGHATIEYGTRRLREAKRIDSQLRALLEGEQRGG
jgi:hypothetical protein